MDYGDSFFVLNHFFAFDSYSLFCLFCFVLFCIKFCFVDQRGGMEDTVIEYRRRDLHELDCVYCI